jgi:formate hydrogenlyase subunit 6/NADH:ubiquinone oxidoreductase subunit I
MEGILDKKAMPPDCFSCGVCLDVCPEDAIAFTASRNKSNQIATTSPEVRSEVVVEGGSKD